MSNIMCGGIGEISIGSMNFACLEWKIEVRDDLKIQWELDEFREKLGYPKKLGD